MVFVISSGGRNLHQILQATLKKIPPIVGMTTHCHPELVSGSHMIGKNYNINLFDGMPKRVRHDKKPQHKTAI